VTSNATTQLEPQLNSSRCSARSLLIRFVSSSAALLLLLASLTLYAQTEIVQTPVVAKPKPPKDPAATSLDDYLKRVHAESDANHPAMGAIWTDSSRFARLTSDVRAMQPHDLVSLVVSETLESSTDGSVKGSRSSSASSAITALFQKLSVSSVAQNLLNMNANSALAGQGTSQNNSSLSTILGGEVIEVLPNGMLVVEAARKVEFSQQTQTVVLRGLVRPESISQNNRVLSTDISDLTLQVRGQGIITDYTHRPNILVRLLQRALIF
jgi:flagellar L-ring protein precursor FlgH